MIPENGKDSSLQMVCISEALHPEAPKSPILEPKYKNDPLGVRKVPKFY